MIRIFKHYVPKSLMFLGAGETLILLLAAYLGVSFALGFPAYDAHAINMSAYPAAVTLFPCIMVPTMMALGLYRRSGATNLRDTLLRLSLSLMIGISLMAGLNAVGGGHWINANVIGTSAAAAFIGIVSTRFLFYRFSDVSALKRHVLVIGAGARAAALEGKLMDGALSGVLIKGYLPVVSDDEIGVRVPEQRILQRRKPLQQLIRELQIDELIVALDDRRGVFPSDEILACKMAGTPVTEVLSFIERQTGTIQLDELRPSNMIFSDGFSQAAVKNAEKRVFDIVTSLTLLVLSLPVALLAALAIWVESRGRGDIFYRQVRVGKMGRPFEVLKFRSMTQDAETEGQAIWAQQNDPRITRVGAFIRKTRIDELPQLINVLKGEMSFVGPRPERPEFVSGLIEEIPYYSLRHYVNPGITGWAQVSYPYGASVDDAREKLQYDLYYLKNYSLFLDFAILFQTVQVCLFGDGAR